MINIIDKKDCCGCTACVQRCPKQCISMLEDGEGFLYPKVDETICIGCGLCEKVCPVVHQDESHKPLKTYAAINSNEDLRMQSSSGGIFTLLAEQVINDRGIVFGARFDENWMVQHDYTETIEGLAALRGSKYVQSRIEDSYRKAEQFLKQGRQVLFVGTSCQISGLKKFLHKEFDNLLAVDFICHGVPSPGLWRQYLKETLARHTVQGEIARKNTIFPLSLNSLSSIEGIEFRDKKMHGWNKFSFVLRLTKETADGENKTVLFSDIHYQNVFMEAFLKNYILRPSCYSCPAKGGTSGSDITLADYWGINKVLPEIDDDKGTGLVLINTPKGTLYFQRLNDVLAKETSFNDAIYTNPSYYKSVAIPINRTRLFAHLQQGRPFYAVVKEVVYLSTPQKIKRNFIAYSKLILKKLSLIK